MNRGSSLRASVAIGAFIAAVVYGVMLVIAFDPGVQGLDPSELFARTDDARAFLVADLFFPLLYGGAFPIAAWRFGRSVTGGRPPWLFAAACSALVVGALFDIAENVALLVAVDDRSADLVDIAHGIAGPKLICGVAGQVLALVIFAQAVLSLRRAKAGSWPRSP